MCFRDNRELSDESELNRMNEELLIRIQETGVAVPSGTRVSGRFAIRVAVTNHRSTRADFRLLVNQVLKLGSDLQEGDRIGEHYAFRSIVSKSYVSVLRMGRAIEHFRLLLVCKCVAAQLAILSSSFREVAKAGR
jgi:hypothetical protein